MVARLTGKAFYTANTPDGREAFAKDRLARLAARIEAGKAEADLKTPLAPAEAESLKARVAALRETESHLRARMGDPLLFADAPRNAQSVVATLPNGEVVPLQWDAAAARWQCRFDIPTYATEGEYVVSVAITLADGASTVREFRYTVDITAPKGIVTATRTGSTVRVEVVSDADTVRVVVVAASGTVPLVAAPARPGHFFGLVANPSATVTLVLTDRAHNRATVTTPVMEGGKR